MAKKISVAFLTDPVTHERVLSLPKAYSNKKLWEMGLEKAEKEVARKEKK